MVMIDRCLAKLRLVRVAKLRARRHGRGGEKHLINRPPNDQFLLDDSELEKRRKQHYWSTQLEGDRQQTRLRSVTKKLSHIKEMKSRALAI